MPMPVEAEMVLIPWIPKSSKNSLSGFFDDALTTLI